MRSIGQKIAAPSHITFVTVLLVPPLGVVAQSQTQQQQIANVEADSRPRYAGYSLMSAAAQEAFDIPVGGSIRGVVPVDEATREGRAALRQAWEGWIFSAYQPTEETVIEWRTILWSQVDWAPPRSGSKGGATGPLRDEIIARWIHDGAWCVVRGTRVGNDVRGLSISLTAREGVDPFRECRYLGSPMLDSTPDRALDGSERLCMLRMLRSRFVSPWTTENEFTARWNLSPTRPGEFYLEQLSTTSGVNVPGIRWIAFRVWFPDSGGLSLQINVP